MESLFWLDQLSLLLGFAIIVLLILLLRASKENANYFPGPRGFPVIGHVPLVGMKPWKTFLKWKYEFGDVIMITMGGIKTIIMNDMTAAQHILNLDDAGGLMPLDFVEKFVKTRGGPGLSFQQGERWRELRNFLVKCFSEFGSKDGKFISGISTESQRLCTDLKEIEGRPVSLKLLFNQYMLNSVWKCIAQNEFSAEETHALVKAITACTDFASPIDAIAMNFASFFDKFTSILKWRYESFEKMRLIVRRNVDAQLKTRIPGHPRDMVDKFQDVVDTTTDPESSFHSSKELIYSTMVDVVIGASDTSANTLEWFLMFALRHPHLQTKIQEEIDSIIGQDRLPEFSDQAKMPFTEACILEALRIRPAATYGVPKRSLADITVYGKVIPKDALLVANIMGMNHDPRVWDNPEEFIPERFLLPTGSTNLEMKKKLCTFSFGKRQCPGEKFAKETLFMMITHLLQNFNLATMDEIDFEPVLGFVAFPSKSISVSFRARKLS